MSEESKKVDKDILFSNQVVNVEKQIQKILKYCKEYSNAANTSRQKLSKIGIACDEMDTTGNKKLTKDLKTLSEGTKNISKHMEVMQTRLDNVFFKDLQQFSKSWALIKNLTLQICEPKKKNKNYQTARLQQKEEKELKGLELKIQTTLKDIRDPIEEFVHSQLYFHAKSLEIWSKVWEEFKKEDKRIEKESKKVSQNTTAPITSKKAQSSNPTIAMKSTSFTSNEDSSEEEEDE